MLLIVAAAMGTVALFRLYLSRKSRWFRLVPASLMGLVAACAVEYGIVRPAGFKTVTIGDAAQVGWTSRALVAPCEGV